MTLAEIDHLFEQTLIGDYEDEAPWEAVFRLRSIGSGDVLAKAVAWCSSDLPLKRARGIDVLAQLGVDIGKSNSFPEECFSTVAALLQSERDLRPLCSAIFALGHLHDPAGLPIILKFQGHSDREVRFAVACALGSFPNDAASIAAQMPLMRDDDKDIRDWATFGLGNLGDVDSTEIRDALADRLGDTDWEVREEAMVALGKRKDPRVLSPLLDELDKPTMTCRIIEAAYLMLGMNREREEWNGRDYAKALRESFPGCRSGRET